MAEVRCPNCGKINPDLLEVCQFCQTPLKPESVLRIGDTPTKKNTGELESILPDWLRDVRQQARDSAEEDAAQAAAQPKIQKDEPPDLLAGLASQVGSADENEIPDWLASINPTAEPKPTAPSTAAPAPETDFFAQFNQSGSESASESSEEDISTFMGETVEQSPVSQEKDELSEWFTQASEQPEEILEFDSDIGHRDDAASGSGFDSPLPIPKESPPKEEEDLSWLRDLEAASKQTGDLQAPKKDMVSAANFEMPSSPSQPSGSQEDLSWLDSLGGIEEAQQQPSEQAAAARDDLSWLDQFSGVQGLPSIDNTQEKPSFQEDSSWLDSLGSSKSEPSQPLDTAPDKPISSQPFASEEDLSWLKGIDGEPEPLSTPPFAEPDSFTENTAPRQTAPLGQKEAPEGTEPDWLKSAIEAPSMPAPGDLSMDWFSQKDQPFGTAPSARTSQDKPVDEKPVPPKGTPQPSPFSDLLSTPSESSPLSNQDVDSLFSEEMPDWLTHPEPTTGELAASQQVGSSSAAGEDLAPVDLPSWVQAMRPVEAVISETVSGSEDQPEEKEGPLAGLRGVIPGAPMGSSRRPRAISLKLQATDEQQASAALLEQILGSETNPRTLVTSSFIGSQQVLRWILTGLFLIVLSLVILLRSQTMPVSTNLPVDASGISNALTSIPADARVLVVIDYEPSLSGEMEAVAAPLLNQMALLSHPNLSFVSTSPNGPGLTERLMTAARLNQPAPDGLGYQAGVQYLNLGFLPGGSAGVLGFMERPGETISTSSVQSFSEYAALIVITDHAESGRVWVEQLQSRKQIDPLLASQPLLVVASAQAGPLLQPYVSSGQVAGMISGLSDAGRYESVNNVPPRIARSYWDAFGIGLMMAVALIVVGSLWSVFTGMRARRAETEQG